MPVLVSAGVPGYSTSPPRSFCAASPPLCKNCARKSCGARNGCGTRLATGEPMAKARILVVDDEANARAALRTNLSEEGYEISDAADGEAALARIAELSPNVVPLHVRISTMA